MDDSLTVDIIDQVANARGVEAEDLEFVLSDYIDMDALEQLAAHDRATWSLTFEIPDQEVTVTSDGTIRVDDIKNEVDL